MDFRRVLFKFLLIFIFIACDDENTELPSLEIIDASIGPVELSLNEEVTENVPVDKPITLTFSAPIDPSTITSGISLERNGSEVNIDIRNPSDNTIRIFPIGILEAHTVYNIVITDMFKSVNGKNITPQTINFRTKPADLELLSVKINGEEITNANRVTNVDTDVDLSFTFSSQINLDQFKKAFDLSKPTSLEFSSTEDQRTFTVSNTNSLEYLSRYILTLSNDLNDIHGSSFSGYQLEFYTQIDSTLRFPVISNEELLTKVQEQTFKYFWDFAHPNSGLARERNTSDDLVTIGGSGFGVMSIIAGIERGFITRQEGVDRLEKIVNFLENADRFHGVWPHWMNGNTGNVIPFSQKDDGGDLVETAFMIQGLLTVREYLNSTISQEAAIKNKITQLWKEVEWDWYTKGGENVLYWHWSPNFGWEMNLPIRGWNESLIVYVLAASSPTHSIDPVVYHEGWARNGAIKNGNSYYGISLPLGYAFGGPLFFAHYSFLGLDPRNLEDKYANYWEQNVSHSLINQQHAVVNPFNYVGYGENAWGFTASDDHEGYSAHSPTNDEGVITPTAALSSFPYTPEHSMDALHHFYYLMGDKLWGSYGFIDAYNPTVNWYANSFLAIDQGPIIVMIENYRTALLWNLFMKNPEIKQGLDKLGFTSY